MLSHWYCLWHYSISEDGCCLHFLIHDLITGIVTGATRRVPLVNQELLTLPEHTSPPQGFLY
jgi:hypothetical protein